MKLKFFTFNPFAENTYILYDATKECAIIDPGMSNPREEKELTDFIESEGLKPVLLLNTHCHIDHVLGNHHIAEIYGLKLSSHKGEVPVLDSGIMVSQMYGIPYTASPPISEFLEGGDTVSFGNTSLKVLLTPGHSPASISFFHSSSKTLIAGDVLFQGSIGRTDLPGGDYDTLIHSIESQFYPLGDDVVVYPGHGPSTTIGAEKRTNPFLR